MNTVSSDGPNDSSTNSSVDVLDANGNRPSGSAIGTLTGIYWLGDEDNEYIFGSSWLDKLYGGDGNDILYGFEGDDIILGRNGQDSIFGGPGDDIIYTGDYFNRG